MNKKIAIMAVIISAAAVISVILCVYFSRPRLTVSYIGSTTEQGFIANAIKYDFEVVVNVPSSTFFPFGEHATSSAINNALKPLLDKYNLCTGTYDSIITVAWFNRYIADGKSIFSVLSNETFTDTQIKSLTNDLFEALTAAMNSTP